jgi:hypothetical protein
MMRWRGRRGSRTAISPGAVIHVATKLLDSHCLHRLAAPCRDTMLQCKREVPCFGFLTTGAAAWHLGRGEAGAG